MPRAAWRPKSSRKCQSRLRQQRPSGSDFNLHFERAFLVPVPVSSPETCDEFRSEADEIVCALTPEHFQGVGLWYEDFSRTSDEEVRGLLKRATQPQQHAMSRAR